jgi:cytochrome c-type biogenesis protein
VAERATHSHVPACHELAPPVAASPLAGVAAPAAAPALLGGQPRAAVLLALALGTVGLVSAGWALAVPFPAAVFGGLTVPVVLGAGLADGLNPCAFALLVLFATYTLTMVGRVTSEGSPTLDARRQVLGAGAVYVGAVWLTYLVIGLGLLSFLGWLGEDHLVTRIAVVIALAMAVWMIKDVLLPGVGPSLGAPAGTHGLLQRAMERGGLGAMLLAGVLVGICTVPCSGAIYINIVAILNASGGGATGLALLALYNVAFITPLVLLLGAVSDRRVLGRLGRWNRANAGLVKLGLAVLVLAMSFGLLLTL